MTFHYHYSALPEGNIRLLSLLPHGGDKYAPIECELLHYPLLDQDNGPGLYEALSYAWGSSDKPEQICIDKHNVPVTASLHAALHSLRNRSLPRIIWVDAICIDQVNTEELSKQVQMMALIYAKAARVIVWLGDATVDSDRAIERIRVASRTKNRKEATSRPKYIRGRLGGFTLGIRPLADLIGMFHTRQATDRRDKVYALLGMRSDLSGVSDLMPDYNLSWRELFRKLVKALLSHRTNVTTWESQNIAVIQSSGYVLGHVHLVYHASDREIMEVRTPWAMFGRRRGISLPIESTSAPVLDGDIICLLDGAAKPTIIRLCGNQSVIVRISVDLMGNTINYHESIQDDEMVPRLPRSFFLIWDWERTATSTHGQGYYGDLFKVDETFHKSQLALILWDSGSFERAEESFQELWKVSKEKLGWDHPGTVKYIRYLASLYREIGNADLANRFQAMAKLTSQSPNCSEMEQTGAYVAESFDHEVMLLLLERWKHKTKLPEAVVEAAARNRKHGIEVMRSLRQRRSEIKTTQEVVLAAARNDEHGRELLKFLFDEDGDDINFTDEVLLAASTAKHGDLVLMHLLNRSKNQSRITDTHSFAGAGKQFDGMFILRALLDRTEDRTDLAEDVTLAALENPRAKSIVEYLLYRGNSEFVVTEAVLKTIVKHTHGLDMLYRLSEEGYIFAATEDVITAAVDSLGLSETPPKAKKSRLLLSTAMEDMKTLAERRGRRSDRENLQFSIRNQLEELRLLGST
ncbi:hypothetical protein G7054_g545 [Neopestalotiopsis clavispora]|nr:hypothetical protein G7054_g545 [Neopestalotiopsis clavispora]